MYQFLLNMWVFNNLSEERLQNYVTKGFVTQEQANQIMATPRAEQ